MIWFNDPSALLENPSDFWPSSTQSFPDKVNATSRFIIYSSIIAFGFKKDPKILLLGVLVLAAIYMYFKINPVHNLPTVNQEDPMNNFSDDRMYDPDSVSRIMSKVFPDDKRNAERGFFTMPTMDLEPFLELQGRGRPYCRDDQSACTAEGNTHFPDETTMRAQYGLTGQLSRW
jgi:hypothetical protein